jgi:hypothetical protein
VTATITVTREDAQTLWAAASALRHAESRHRCEHLAPKVAQLSERISRAVLAAEPPAFEYVHPRHVAGVTVTGVGGE